MKTFTILILLAFLVVRPEHSSAQFLTDNLLFTAKLNGKGIDPPLKNGPSGVAAVTINGTRDTMCLSVNLSGIGDSITGLGLYSTATDSSGILAIDFSPVVENNTLQTSVVGTFLNADNIAHLLMGDYDIRVFTNGNSDPVIAGMLRLESDYSFSAVMDGSQEVPASGSGAYGMALFKLNMDSSKMRIEMIVQGLTGAITGAHLHMGKEGVSGPVVVDLSEFIDDNVIQATIDSAEFLSIIDSLMNGEIYINVHTDIYPNGEVRGQVHMDKGIAFHTFLTGDQEVPSVNTNAVGLAHFLYNAGMDSVIFHVMAIGINDSITGAHLHFGEPGETGPVVVDLSESDTLNSLLLQGVVSSASLSDTLMRDLLMGKIYINLHTPSHPDGEIRGQMRRYLWEGFTYTMNGSQELPAVVTTGMGGGYVAINPEQSNLHFAFAADNLSDTCTAAHFHAAPAGKEGAAIFTLTPFLQQHKDSISGMGAVFGEGFWDDQSNPPLEVATVTMFTNDSIYINLHTVLAPNGEIRGQVIHGAGCFDPLTAIPVIPDINQEVLIIYPNPVSDIATISVYGNWTDEKVTLKLYDLQGQLLWSTSSQLNIGNWKEEVDLSGFAPGMYFLEVKNQHQSVIGKIQKQ